MLGLGSRMKRIKAWSNINYSRLGLLLPDNSLGVHILYEPGDLVQLLAFLGRDNSHPQPWHIQFIHGVYPERKYNGIEELHLAGPGVLALRMYGEFIRHVVPNVYERVSMTYYCLESCSPNNVEYCTVHIYSSARKAAYKGILCRTRMEDAKGLRQIGIADANWTNQFPKHLCHYAEPTPREIFSPWTY